MMNKHLFILGLFVHLVLLYSIFDVYYKSPLVKGTRPHVVTNGDGAAKRVVIFSADGLRSTALFANPERSPYLHEIIRNGAGVWGISKSHVPTESRPGHVAMMAGFYEDVSAVTLGWKHNPVTFDSVFNQSRFSYMWGSPDILPMFAHGLNHTRTEMYTHEEEDFASSNAADLDRWVFDKVESFFNQAREDKSGILGEKLNQNRQIFFLHLLGLDTNGHGHKPHSEQYLSNIAVVDEGIKNMTSLFRKHFNDDQTAFIFTADHGMTDWGSHGSGTDDEILTPFIAWGSGIQRKRSKQVINQVDIAPLVSALLGTAIPMNSVGVLPLDFLSVTPYFRYQAACANLKQMVEQYNIRRKERESNALPYMYKDFPGFRSSVLNKVQDQVLELKAQRRLDQAARFCLEWVPRVRDALIYFHRYQRTTLGIAIASLFITWNLTLFAVFSRSSKANPIDLSTFLPGKLFVAVLVTGGALICYQKLPFMHYLYYLLPVYLTAFCWNVDYFEGIRIEGFRLKELTRDDLVGVFSKYLCPLLLFGVALSIFVSAFFHRSVLSIMLLFVAFLPLIHGNHLYPWNRLWTGASIALAVFPLLETVGKNPNPALIVLAPLLAAALLKLFIKKCSRSTDAVFNSLPILMASAAALNLVSNLFENAPFVVKLCSWLSLPFAFALPLLASRNLSERTITWLTALFLPYSVLTLAYESVFVLIFSVLLFTYVRLEFSHLSDDQFFQLEVKAVSKTDSDIHGQYSPREWQRAFLLIALTLLAFFGTGNIASLNSFNPTFLRNFITVFSPFTMAALLIFKIAVPFLSLALAYSAILHLEHRTLVRLSVLLMIITDSMAMIFFFFLRDEGSWLDIGMSISNFVISMVSSAIVFLLLHLANFLLPLTTDEIKATILYKNTDSDV